MVEDIKLDIFPKKAGIYIFKVNNEVIYVGSSKNLHQRMTQHRSSIRKGSEHGYKQDLYQYLKSNQFTVEFQLTDNYSQIEQVLIEKYNPKYNSHRAYTGCGARKGREAEYNKERYQKYKEEISEQARQYYESNKEQIKQHQKQYNESNKEQVKQHHKEYYNHLCCFNSETLTLNALRMRFKRMGFANPTAEAKKYLIGGSND